MKAKAYLLSMIALIQSLALPVSALDPSVEVQETRSGVGFSIEVGPSPDYYYYGPYDPYGPCFGPGGVYMGPGCPQYYYGPGLRYYYYRDGRHHRYHDGRRHHGRHHR